MQRGARSEHLRLSIGPHRTAGERQVQEEHPAAETVVRGRDWRSPAAAELGQHTVSEAE